MREPDPDTTAVLFVASALVCRWSVRACCSPSSLIVIELLSFVALRASTFDSERFQCCFPPFLQAAALDGIARMRGFFESLVSGLRDQANSDPAAVVTKEVRIDRLLAACVSNFHAFARTK